MSSTSVNWTEVLITLITVAGTVVSGYFAMLTKRNATSAQESVRQSSLHASLAAKSATVAVNASIKPMPSLHDIGLGFEGDELGLSERSEPPLDIVTPPEGIMYKRK